MRRGDSALIYFVCFKGKRDGIGEIVPEQMGANIGRQSLEEGSFKKETWFVTNWKQSKHASFEGFISPDKGRLENASYLWKSSRANNFNNRFFKAS